MELGVLQARGLSKQFFRKGRDSARHFDAVAPCDLVLRPKTVTVLMGRSGSGKSTLLNMLAGLLEPTAGTVELDGKSLYDLDDAQLSRLRNSSFGVIPQGQTAVRSLTVIDNVKLPHMLYQSDDVEDKARALLADMGIDGLADSYPHELSGGELKRMAIARALVNDPAFVFADEPTADLDDESTRVVLDLLKATARRGAAVFLVTHEQAGANIADELLKMAAGKLDR